MKRILAFSFVLLLSVDASAQVVGIGNPSFSPQNPSLSTLSDSIANAKSTKPDLFVGLENVRKNVAEMDAKKRGRFLPTGQHFSAMGPDFVVPLASVVWDEYQSPELEGSARVSFLVGAIESFANHQNPVVVPLLFSVLKHETDHFVVRATTEAIGRLGTDAQIIDLVTFANNDDVRAGLRGCRRMACARTLSGFLETADDDQARTAVKSLGSIGNVWAWETAEVQSKDDGLAVREFAAQTLIQQFVQRPALRKEIRKSILVVNHPQTQSMIDAVAKSADSSTRQALLSLSKRVQNNPLSK